MIESRQQQQVNQNFTSVEINEIFRYIEINLSHTHTNKNHFHRAHSITYVIIFKYSKYSNKIYPYKTNLGVLTREIVQYIKICYSASALSYRHYSYFNQQIQLQTALTHLHINHSLIQLHLSFFLYESQFLRLKQSNLIFLLK